MKTGNRRFLQNDALPAALVVPQGGVGVSCANGRRNVTSVRRFLRPNHRGEPCIADEAPIKTAARADAKKDSAAGGWDAAGGMRSPGLSCRIAHAERRLPPLFALETDGSGRFRCARMS